VGRFEYLRATNIPSKDKDPFKFGYWQASFNLTKEVAEMSLREFLEKLRASETHRTGWDIGWVPTRSGIAPYPYKDGIEVWLAERDIIEPAHSDFWRAEPVGRFSLFRGYREDEKDFPIGPPGTISDFSLVLWRISELLLYIESFSKNLDVPDSGAIVKVTWNGLKNRKIGYHKNPRLDKHYVSRQESVSSTCEIKNSANIKSNLIHDVYVITKPLFETFNFFSLTKGEIKAHIKELFDPDQEASR
jgi:hypothetical protein